MKIRVLHIIDSLRAGGAETTAVNLVNALNRRDSIDAYLCTTRKEGSLKNNLEDLSKYFFLSKNRAIDIKAIIALFEIIKENKIELIHAHSTSFFMAYISKLRFRKIKIIWHNHTGANIELHGWRMTFLKLCSMGFNATINVNELLNNWSKKKLKVNHNFVMNNFPVLRDANPITILKSSTIHKIVCVAGLRPEKDHLNLLDSFSIVCNKNDDVSLHLVGKDYGDDYAKSIKNVIKKQGLDNKVFLYSSCDDIGNILYQATIGVLSSKSEGLPIALLEYGLAGLPVIVTDVGACSKVITNEVSGIVVKKESPEDLAKGLLMLINDKEQSNGFGQRLKLMINENYSKNKCLEILEQIYYLIK